MRGGHGGVNVAKRRRSSLWIAIEEFAGRASSAVVQATTTTAGFEAAGLIDLTQYSGKPPVGRHPSPRRWDA